MSELSDSQKSNEIPLDNLASTSEKVSEKEPEKISSEEQQAIAQIDSMLEIEDPGFADKLKKLQNEEMKVDLGAGGINFEALLEDKTTEAKPDLTKKLSFRKRIKKVFFPILWIIRQCIPHIENLKRYLREWANYVAKEGAKKQFYMH